VPIIELFPQRLQILGSCSSYLFFYT